MNGEPGDGCESTTCTPTAGGQEICDLRDNDCDGTADEDLVKTEPSSCGPLCTVCAVPNAEPACVQGACAVGACLPGWHDLNGAADDGCEYACTPGDPPVEVCDATDNDCDGLVDEGLLCACPEEMVLVEGAFCIDRYEASRPDATATSVGVDSSYPTSREGVQPWRNVSHDEAAAACDAAGKRLCTAAEFEQACRGPDQTVYCYGDDYDPYLCNGIDAFWPNFHPTPTGDFPECTNEYGVFDINGNLWERIQGGLATGGAYNCSDSEALHRCDLRVDWGTAAKSNFGFRCCL
jgi:hypothetical protein